MTRDVRDGMRRTLWFAVCSSVIATFAGCVVDDSVTESSPGELTAADSAATIPTDDSQIVQHPTGSICSGGTWKCFAHRRIDEQTGEFVAYASPSQSDGFGAADLQAAYKIPSTTVTATIGIIGAYGYSNLATDLASYRTEYGLPACTVANGCLKIVNQSGSASPLPSAAPSNDDWTQETALDVDMASAACPSCKILVVQASDDSGDGLLIANDTAASLGATVISNSWGSPESGVSSQETYFNHPGIAIFVAAGDDGYNDGGEGPDYPGTSAHTIGVGGTSLTKSASTTRGWTEKAWSDGGSSCSTSVAKPSWQTASTCAKRAASDVSAVGDPNTGVATYNKNAGGWSVIGGTSAASPLVAGIFAVTGHGGETAQFMYTHTSDFNDVTTGSNGSCGTILCKATTGWDGPTGIGTPNGSAMAGTAGTGSSGSDAPPVVAITSPANNATVPPGFSVKATATDDHGVAKVELLVDGAMTTSMTAGPYTFTTSSTMAEGQHTIEVLGIDSAGQQTTSTITVTVSDSASGDGDGSGSDGSGSGSGSGGSTGGNGGNGGNDEAANGGGCDASGHGGSSGTLLAMGLALAAITRRRR
jgi:uncharacterized protein (TIGR03382 family)